MPPSSTDTPSRVQELDLLESVIPPGLTVIEASAGTGKTYSISHLVPRLLLDGTIDHLGQFLLVTFTKDATRELADRVRRVLTRLGEPADAKELSGRDPDVAGLRRRLDGDTAARARLVRALADLDQLAVSTIHAFCQRTLQQEGALCGLPVLPEVVTDDRVQLEQEVRDLWLDTVPKDPVLAAVSVAQKWDVSAAVSFIATYRKAERPVLEPQPRSFDELKAEVARLCAHLRDPERSGWKDLVDCLKDELETKVKAGGPMAHVRERLSRVQTVDPARVEFWVSLVYASQLPDFIKQARGGKAAIAEVTACGWYQAVVALSAAVENLECAWHYHLATEVSARLEAMLRRRRLITQDGLVGALHAALTAPGESSARLAARLADRYRVALVDESQDTDPRQFALFDRIFLRQPDRRLLLIGDPKQAIYGFRGADLSTYLRARSRAVQAYGLTRTFRAPPRLVGAVNTLFAQPGALHHAGLGFTPARSGLDEERTITLDQQEQPRLTFWLARDDAPEMSTKPKRQRALAGRTADQIVALLRDGVVRTRPAGPEAATTERRVRPSDIAVLCRDGSQTESVAEAVEARGVPVLLNSGEDVFLSEEARELRLLLRAVLEPRRPTGLRRALATRLLGLDAAAISGLEQAGANSGGATLDRWREQFRAWAALWEKRGIAALFTALEAPVEDLIDQGVSTRLATLRPGGERRVTNYRQLTDLLLDAAREQAPRPGDLVRWLGQRVARAVERDVPEDHQIQLASEGDAVRVMTMHKAKGLEFDFVFCPFLADPVKTGTNLRVFPRGEGADADAVVDLAKAGEERKWQAFQADLEESLRLTYVALTRAKIAAWTCSYTASSRNNPGVGPLDWLLRSASERERFPQCDDAWISQAKASKAKAAAPGVSRHERHGETLKALGQTCADLACADLPAATGACWSFASSPTLAANGDGPALRLRALAAPAVPVAWQVTSFSRLTHTKRDAAPLSERADATPAPDLIDASLRRSDPISAAPAVAFLESPAGAAVGTAVHDWIETWDFSPVAAPTGDPAEPTPLQRHLKSAGLPEPREGQPAWEPALRELFNTLREVRPTSGGAPLAELCPEAHGSEWHFHLPIKEGADFCARGLAACFREHAPEAYRDYAQDLAGLSEQTVSGLLQGFIDRLACVDGAWGVIDWKTNRLGDDLSAYDEAGLMRCARDNHYLLQMHLYLVAVRRWRRSLGEAEPKLAGAWLVFLRGIAPGEERGVLALRPGVALLDALDALFAPVESPATGGETS